MKSGNYLFLWLVEVFYNVVHGFPDSLLDLPRIRPGVPPREGSDAQPPSHGGRLLLGRGAALLAQLFVSRGGHQLSNEDSLQAAIIHAFSQPPPTGELVRVSCYFIPDHDTIN